MILFRNGAPAATKVGAEPKSRIQAWLEGALGADDAVPAQAASAGQ